MLSVFDTNLPFIRDYYYKKTPRDIRIALSVMFPARTKFN